jgi:hypothetical protein
VVNGIQKAEAEQKAKVDEAKTDAVESETNQ